MVVDLGRSRSVSSQVYQDFMNCRVSHLATLQVSPRAIVRVLVRRL